MGIRRTGEERQKESILGFWATKGNAFLSFADRHSFLSVPSRIAFCILIYICLLILTKNPQKRRLLSAQACDAFRSEHFFAPQNVAWLSAHRRIPVLFSEFFLLEYGILASFFPCLFLFGAGKALPVKKQKESRMAWWLTRPASSGARVPLPACTCQAKAAFR